MKRKIVLPIAGFAAVIIASVAFAATMTDRGLPDSNLNDGAGSSRSNVAWSFGNDWMTGDDFTVGATGETWVVTGITTWQVGMLPDSAAELGDRYDSVSLYGGPADPGGVSLLATGTLEEGSSINSNADITHTKVTYDSVLEPNYQGSSGSQIQLWETSVTGLSWVVSGGVLQNFAIDGTVRPDISTRWFNHASNAALSGTPQQGADGFFLGWDKADLSQPPFYCDSGNADDCGGWDKSSDINVIVTAHPIPSSELSCKKGGWQTLFRVDGSTFKNQGDCVSYSRNGK